MTSFNELASDIKRFYHRIGTSDTLDPVEVTPVLDNLLTLFTNLPQRVLELAYGQPKITDMPQNSSLTCIMAIDVANALPPNNFTQHAITEFRRFHEHALRGAWYERVFNDDF